MSPLMKGFRVLLLATCVTCSLNVLAAPAVLRTLDSQWQLQQQEQARQLILQQSQPPVFQLQPPNQRGSAHLEPMYSAQAGSWPFEPFVHSGLFKAIASYQTQHPRALVIRGGSMTLEQLLTQVNNPQVLRRHADGYLLSYPLMIAEDAALLIDNQKLYLLAPSGTALINLGFLRLQKARLESSNDGRPSESGTRPFIMNWAGSRLQIENSRLVNMGYEANFSRGISSGLSTQQPANRPVAVISINNSRFEDLFSALDLRHSHALIRDSQFSRLKQYAISISNSRFLIADNRIDGGEQSSGIRITGSTSGRIQNNLILRTSKSAVEVSEQTGSLLIQGNHLGASKGYGLKLRQVRGAGLLIENNLIANNQLTAIDASELSGAWILNNRIQATPQYAISLRNEQLTAGQLVISGNILDSIGKSMIRVEGMQNTVLGNNQFHGNPLLQALLIGDLLPLQSQILDSTVRRSCYLQISQGLSSEINSSSAPVCSH